MTPVEPNDQPAADTLVLNSPEEASTPKDFLLWAGVIVLGVLTIYSPALHGKFLWDDDRHVELNRNLRDGRGLVNIWTKIGASRGGTVQYYPLTHTTYWLEYQLSGAQPGRIGTTIFHISNMALHAAAAVLLWFLLRELAVPGAWVAAAVFALHPIQAESVAWISERKNVLAGVFFFGSILCYVRAQGRGSGVLGLAEQKRDPRPQTLDPSSYYWLSLALFTAAMLSKTVACTMPAVVLVLIWWKRGRLTVKDFINVAPFFAMAIGLALLTAWVEHREVGAAGPEWSLSIAQRILIAGRAVWHYALKIVFPHRLTFIYPRWSVDPAQAWQWVYPIGCSGLLLPCVIASAADRRRRA
jgi:hypothetical protein